MLYVSKMIPSKCFQEVCGTAGCERFLCFDLSQDHLDPYCNRVIYDKTTKALLVSIYLSPIKPIIALANPQESNAVIVGDETSSHIYVSLQWLAGKGPPPAIVKQYQELESFFLQNLEKLIPGETVFPITYNLIHPGSETIQ